MKWVFWGLNDPGGTENTGLGWLGNDVIATTLFFPFF